MTGEIAGVAGRGFGPQPALIDAGRQWSYTDLTQAAVARARRLSQQGVKPGQVLVCRAEPGYGLLVLQQALAQIGAALLPVRPGLFEPAQAADLQALIHTTGAEWVWSEGDDGEGGGAPTGRNTALPWQGDPLAVLIQTSGSSGTPKVAMLTRRAVLASCRRVNRRLGLGVGDQWLCCLQPHHVGGLAIGYRCALAGATLRLQPRLAQGFDADAVAAELQREPITHLSLVPPMLARLLAIGVRPPASLRVVQLGGQALSADLGRRALDAGWPVVVTYGMSETFSQVVTARYSPEQDPDAETPARGFGADARLPDVELDAGRCGEAPRPLRIRGPMLMSGYANPERRPGIGLDGDWLTTTDLGCVDAAGRLRLLGRADDVLVIGGVKVLPAEVEARLGTLPGIQALALVGIPHTVWGQTLALCYAGRADPAAVEDWCRARLPSVQRPRLFVRCEALPLLASGKLDRAALRALAMQQMERGPTAL
ncbi:class I adenylate-forming enzyme family protein [Thiohalocapsa marina]|uniref:class I adenylate-forming enzyme family protein n=1 Tax=Thiohalocapsa marina TaxID=424902 RepID=UPI0014791C57|nr:AMP-binding protein [Thiohalocapsa marina]